MHKDESQTTTEKFTTDMRHESVHHMADMYAKNKMVSVPVSGDMLALARASDNTVTSNPHYLAVFGPHFAESVCAERRERLNAA